MQCVERGGSGELGGRDSAGDQSVWEKVRRCGVGGRAGAVQVQKLQVGYTDASPVPAPTRARQAGKAS